MKYYSDCFVIGRKNPSNIGGGFTVFNEKNEMICRKEFRKSGFTNNEGELRGILEALRIANFGDYVITDSMTTFYWVRSGNPKARPDLVEIAQEAHDLKMNKNITLMWEERARNLAGIFNEDVQKKNKNNRRHKKKVFQRNPNPRNEMLYKRSEFRASVPESLKDRIKLHD